MADFKIDDRELKKLMRGIARASKQNPKAIKKMMNKIGVIVHRLAEIYAPRSATKSEYVSTLKGGRTKRKASSFTTGNLKKSIMFEVKKNSVEVGIPINSLKTHEYAEKMHDEKGTSWHKVGKHNESRARDKYIYKAYEDSKDEIDGELNAMLDSLIKGAFK